MTIREALDVSKRSISFREAEIFLSHAAGLSRVQLHMHPDQVLTLVQSQTFEKYLIRREANEPVAYIIGSKEFYGRLFSCDQRALIPRPETEGLLDQALELLPKRFHSQLKATNKPCPIRILELGTGCGNIAVTLSLELAARHIPVEITATDISTEALCLAEENWQSLRTPAAQPPRWLVADLFDEPVIQTRAPYDLVIANLPYVPSAWRFDPLAQPDVIFYEPDISLFGGEDGLDLYRRFFMEVKNFTQPDGFILIEYNENQTQMMLELITTALPQAGVQVQQDYAGLDRTVVIDLQPKLRYTWY